MTNELVKLTMLWNTGPSIVMIWHSLYFWGRWRKTKTKTIWGILKRVAMDNVFYDFKDDSRPFFQRRKCKWQTTLKQLCINVDATSWHGSTMLRRWFNFLCPLRKFYIFFLQTTQKSTSVCDCAHFRTSGMLLQNMFTGSGSEVWVGRIQSGLFIYEGCSESS